MYKYKSKQNKKKMLALRPARLADTLYPIGMRRAGVIMSLKKTKYS